MSVLTPIKMWNILNQSNNSLGIPISNCRSTLMTGLVDLMYHLAADFCGKRIEMGKAGISYLREVSVTFQQMHLNSASRKYFRACERIVCSVLSLPRFPTPNRPKKAIFFFCILTWQLNCLGVSCNLFGTRALPEYEAVFMGNPAMLLPSERR